MSKAHALCVFGGLSCDGSMSLLWPSTFRHTCVAWPSVAFHQFPLLSTGTVQDPLQEAHSFVVTLGDEFETLVHSSQALNSSNSIGRNTPGFEKCQLTQGRSPGGLFQFCVFKLFERRTAKLETSEPSKRQSSHPSHSSEKVLSTFLSGASAQNQSS